MNPSVLKSSDLLWSCLALMDVGYKLVDENKDGRHFPVKVIRMRQVMKFYLNLSSAKLAIFPSAISQKRHRRSL
jgi:hypothetical protein